MPRGQGINRPKRPIVHFFYKIVFSSLQGFLVVLSLSTLGVLLVLFRMKSVEQDYQINEIGLRKRTLSIKNKQLKAKKANLLSVKNLQRLAKKHGLSRPKQEQIIIIP